MNPNCNFNSDYAFESTPSDENSERTALTTLQPFNNMNASLILEIRKSVNEAIKKNLQEFEEKNKNMFVRLTEEVLVLRKEVGQLKKILLRNDIEDKILPKEPFKEMPQFLEFDSKLMNEEETIHQIKAELAKINILNSTKFVKTCWGRIMTDNLAEKFAWRGTNEKRCVKDTNCSTIIKNVFRAKYEKPDEEFVRATKSFFQFAKNRQQIKAAKTGAHI